MQGSSVGELSFDGAETGKCSGFHPPAFITIAQINSQYSEVAWGILINAAPACCRASDDTHVVGVSRERPHFAWFLLGLCARASQASACLEWPRLREASRFASRPPLNPQCRSAVRADVLALTGNLDLV